MNSFAREPNYLNSNHPEQVVDEALSNINTRLSQARIGFRFAGDRLVAIESDFLFAEVVSPAATLLLSKPYYAGAQSEYMKAQTHFRNELYSEAITECATSFESMMKIICKRRGWPHGETDTASKLLSVCYAHNLIPIYYQNHFTGLKSMLESAIPTPRNKKTAHGSGTDPVIIPRSLASYVLHMSAATLIFLDDAERALP